jgi:hypothetical protein
MMFISRLNHRARSVSSSLIRRHKNNQTCSSLLPFSSCLHLGTVNHSHFHHSPSPADSVSGSRELQSRLPHDNNKNNHNNNNQRNSRKHRNPNQNNQNRNNHGNNSRRSPRTPKVVFNEPQEPIMEADGRLNFGIITTSEQLQAFLPHIRDHDVIAVDTEFLLFPHHRASLEILQAASHSAIGCLDYQALKNKMVPFMEVMMEKHLILHAAQMDLQVFYDFADRYKMKRKFPVRVYDTQVVAAFAGYGDFMGYGNLIDKVMGEEVDKGKRREEKRERKREKREKRKQDDVLYCIVLN